MTTVKVEVFARVNGSKTFKLGGTDCERNTHPMDIAALLRAAAEELEATMPPPVGPTDPPSMDVRVGDAVVPLNSNVHAPNLDRIDLACLDGTGRPAVLMGVPVAQPCRPCLGVGWRALAEVRVEHGTWRIEAGDITQVSPWEAL